MGAGYSPAGRGGAGFDSPLLTVITPSVPPVALRYEGLTKDWALDSRLRTYRSVTSTEQSMILGISINQGQIKSSPQTGNTLNQIKYLGGSNLQADVENRIRNANPVKALVAAGKARIVRVIVQSTRFRLLVQVFFQALDAPNSQVLKRTWSN